jgi:hypothetical protein
LQHVISIGFVAFIIFILDGVFFNECALEVDGKDILKQEEK